MKANTLLDQIKKNKKKTINNYVIKIIEYSTKILLTSEFKLLIQIQ